MRSILKIILKFLAQLTLTKYHPRIVGVTGSVGKTTTKEVIAAVLATKVKVFSSHKNLNNELGLPLAILGEADSGYGSLGAWFGIIARGFKQLLLRNTKYPEVLVLEYGVDHPGDMAYLLSIARPEVAVITAVEPTHLEFLKTMAAVAAEKKQLVTTLSTSGVAVLCADDLVVADFARQTKARVVTFGLGAEAQIGAEAVTVTCDQRSVPTGISFKLRVSGSSLPVYLHGVVGHPSVLASLAAVAVGQNFGVPLIEIVNALQDITWPVGRLRVLSGRSETVLIDDTYNSSPKAATEALRVLSEMPLRPGGRRWAILGDMLELGLQSQEFHRQVGAQVARAGVNYLVTVGKESKEINTAALAAGFDPQHLWHFAESSEVVAVITKQLQVGDVVLIKGSQGVRCERITRALMLEPDRAGELLVRQYKPWV